jgi:exodeoxyribonuclease V alpha subunit
MAEPGTRPPEALLADGFARRVLDWSRRLGAADAAAQAVSLAARHLAERCAQGETCASLETISGLPGWPLPAGESRALLLSSRVVGVVTAPSVQPLILDDEGRLYLHRYFEHEQRLARRLVALADSLPARGYPAQDAPEAIAVRMALERGLTLVSGGPGTGKTTMVVELIGRLLEIDPDCRIALAASTGKAAARMLEAIRAGATQLPASIRDRLPSQASTLHRLLGISPSGGPPGHDAARPLALDVLIVDEASMIDLALASRLFDAIPDGARVVLLGDRDQLAAVEAGSVFADLSGGALPGCTVTLTRSFRFPDSSGIGRIAAAIRSGNADDLLGQLALNDSPALQWIDESSPGGDEAGLLQRAMAAWQPFIDAIRADPRDAASITQAFSRFRLLCATRDGWLGVEAMNRGVTRLFRAHQGQSDPGPRAAWFTGRPVMVLRNDYLLGLFNGDVGITLPDADGELAVFFPTADGGFRSVPPARMPAHETAFAMTIHKSQGSEFDEVMVTLPPPESRVLSRELLYTAVTRARSRVAIVAAEASLRVAIGSPTRRQSGLQARLLETGYHPDATADEGMKRDAPPVPVRTPPTADE